MLHARRTIPTTVLLLLFARIGRAGDGFWTTSGPALGVQAIAADASTPGVVYAATADTIFGSVDGGLSWRAGVRAPGQIQSLLVVPGHAFTVLLATDQGIFRSSDGAVHFGATDLNESAWNLTSDRSGSLIFAASGTAKTLRKSVDGGIHWTDADAIVPVSGRMLSQITALVIHPTNPSLAYAGGAPADMVYSSTAILKTSDGGSSWEERASFGYAPKWRPWISFTEFGGSPDDVVYAGEEPGGRLLQSRGGGSWNGISMPFGAAVSGLAVDRDSGAVYAATNLGVFRSPDDTPSWLPLVDGLTDSDVRALAVEPGGARIHAATSSGVFDLDVPVRAVGPCQPGPANLCLLGGRFRVRLTARNPRTGVVGPGAANDEGDRFGFFALPEFTGDAAFPEVLVKMVDETALPGHSFWFFYSGLTDLSYLLEVEDTATGEVRSYFNDPGSPFCGGADTGIFPAGASESVASNRRASVLPAGEDGSLSLLGGRFEVTLSAYDPNRNRTSNGASMPWNDRSGYFSLPDFTGDPTFPEIFVKMVDYTGVNGEYWFFFTGLTNLPYTVTVVDHVSAAVQRYDSPGPFCGYADTAAFSR